MIRVHVKKDFLGTNAISIVKRHGEGTPQEKAYILRLGDGSRASQTWELLDGLDNDVEPTLRLGREAYEALADAFRQDEGTGDRCRSLRADYDLERARVDRLLDFMMNKP